MNVHSKILTLLSAIALSCLLWSCDPVSTVKPLYTLQVDIALPFAIDSMHTIEFKSASVVCADLNMGSKYTFAWQDTSLFDTTHVTAQLQLPAGYYDIDASLLVTLDSTDISLRAYSRNFVLDPKADSLALSLVASVVQQQNSDFIFAEIFTAGTQTNEGKLYSGDSYFVLYNNTDSVLYADGLVLLESKLKNAQKFGNLTPDFIPDYFGADALYRIPGNGTDYPVPSHGAVLIVDNAQNHLTANPNSFDLTSASFEWYDQSSVASVTDIDNPDVPNLQKIYCYTRTLWIPNRQGNTSFALGRIPQAITDSAYLIDYRCDYNYLLITNAGSFSMSNTCYLFPNDWIVDCVNLCPHSSYQWLAVSPVLDAGWTYIGETGSDKSRLGKSVRRRNADDNSSQLLQDTNNSTLDFLPVQQADPFRFLK